MAVPCLVEAVVTDRLRRQQLVQVDALALAQASQEQPVLGDLTALVLAHGLLAGVQDPSETGLRAAPPESTQSPADRRLDSLLIDQNTFPPWGEVEDQVPVINRCQSKRGALLGRYLKAGKLTLTVVGGLIRL